MEKAKVSVIVPVYNAGKTVERCLDSILSQTHENLEILLINDGSTDNTLQICLDYQSRYSNKIRVIDQANGGPSTARNRGIDEAAGKYLAFVDADDTVAPEMIAAMALKAEENQADMVICSYFRENAAGVTPICYRHPEGLYVGDRARHLAHLMINETADSDIPPYSWVRMMKKSVLDRTGLRFQSGLIRSEDFHLWTKVHFAVDRIYLLSDSQFYYYVDNAVSITHRYIPGYWEDVLFMYRDLLETLPESEDVKRRLGIMLIRRSLIALNVASRCPDVREARVQMQRIIREPMLKDVIGSLSRSALKRYRMYPVLMKYHGESLIILKYLLQNRKHRLKN